MTAPKEFTSEEVARAICVAIGVDPDRPAIIGEPERIRGLPGFYAPTRFRATWTQFVVAADGLARSLDISIKRHPDAGSAYHANWVAEESVIEYRLSPMTLAACRQEGAK